MPKRAFSRALGRKAGLRPVAQDKGQPQKSATRDGFWAGKKVFIGKPIKPMDAFLLLILIMLALLSLLVGGFAFLLIQRQPLWSSFSFRLPDFLRLKIDLGHDDLDAV